MDFKELYENHKNLVYNLALHYVQNAEDAQEISQDVFVAAYRSLDTFKEASASRTWMYRITINKCLDFIKAKKRKKRFAFITSLFHESGKPKHDPADTFHPGVRLEDKEAIGNIFKQINLLPERQKTALILHKIEERSQEEVAEIMEISPKAVELLIRRAKENLSNKLEGSEG